MGKTYLAGVRSTAGTLDGCTGELVLLFERNSNLQGTQSRMTELL